PTRIFPNPRIRRGRRICAEGSPPPPPALRRVREPPQDSVDREPSAPPPATQPRPAYAPSRASFLVRRRGRRFQATGSAACRHAQEERAYRTPEPPRRALPERVAVRLQGLLPPPEQVLRSGSAVHR